MIPEGLIEFLPAMKGLISELNDFLAANQLEFDAIRRSKRREYIIHKLSEENSEIYKSLPSSVALQLTHDRDPHGNVQVSMIETEKLLGEMVAQKLKKENIKATSLLLTISLVMKAVVLLHQTSMQTIATP